MREHILEIITIAVDEAFADAMMLVKHRRDAVESEAIKFEFFDPPTAVRQQISQKSEKWSFYIVNLEGS